MKSCTCAAAFLSSFLALPVGTGPASAEEHGHDGMQTIVFMRHGEKPAGGLGQLNCRGLNRSLALPNVLKTMFGRPDRIFAPNPSVRKDDDGTSYDYIRPLATIEPTAIAQGLPVDTSISFDDVDGLVSAITSDKQPARLVLIAWEHKQIVKAVRRLIKEAPSGRQAVPKWPRDDFDSLYVVKRWLSSGQVSFERRREGLDHLSGTCPTP